MNEPSFSLSKIFAAALFSLIFLSVTTASGCRAQQVDAASNGKPNDEYVILDLVGYNYTDRNIDNYSVNGQGGGNVRLSSPTSGGSGIVCCVRLWNDTAGPMQVEIRWQVDGCKYIVRSSVSGHVQEIIHDFYKEAEVTVSRDRGIKPKRLEVHFYQDGSVQAALTENFSLPRVLRDERRADKSSFPRCKDDAKPE
jgi:hypothetical protein